MLIALVALQDGLGIDLVRFFFRLVVRGCFFDLLKLLLGSFWAASGPFLTVFGPLGTIWVHSWGHFRPPWGRCSVRGCRLATLFESMFAFHFSTFTFGFPSQLFSLWDSLLNLSRLDLNVRIASRESTHPRGAVPTQPQARIPPATGTSARPCGLRAARLNTARPLAGARRVG